MGDYIENLIKCNLGLINSLGLKKGTLLKLKKDYKHFNKGDIFEVKWINKYYGWIAFEETEQLPQGAKEIMEISSIAWKEMIARNL